LTNGDVMTRLLPFLLVCAAVLVAQDSRGDAPGNEDGTDSPFEAALPVGKWNVEFTNGVIEACQIGNGGEAAVEEPRRRSDGTAVAKGGSVVITFHDDRVERWTPVGKRIVVEHWFPASRFPAGTPVRGAAERIP
jgi:hypothetical protein